MSYIDEINKFHKYLRTSDLSASARLLWFVLMDVANSTGWKPYFNVAISTLEAGTGLSRATIKRARKQLQKAGLIKVQSRRGRQSSIYQLMSVSAQLVAQYEPLEKFVAHDVAQYDPQSEPQNDVVGQVVAQYEPQCEPIPRQDKTIYRQDETKKVVLPIDPKQYGELVKKFSSNCHPITPIESQQLQEDLKEYGFQWVSDAITEAVMNGVPRMRYIEGILQDWKSSGGKRTGARGKKKDQVQSDEAIRQAELIPF
jgi:DnaD/phage-associated family protein